MIPDEYQSIDDQEFCNFISEKYNVDVGTLDPRRRERAKLTYFLQCHEQQLNKTMFPNITGKANSVL